MLCRLLKLSTLIAIAAASTMLKAQTADSLDFINSRVKINLHAGVEYNNLGNLRTSFVEIRDYLWANAIKMPERLIHPHSNSFGTSILFSLKDRMYFGISFEHLGTKAYLLYADAGGRVDLKSSLSVSKFFVTGQYVLPYNKYFSPLAEMNLGVLSARYDFTNKIILYPPLPGTIYEKSSGEQNTVAISLLLGAHNNIYKNIVLFEKLGYQFSNISGMPVTVEMSGESTTRTIYTQIDLRGLLLQLGAEYQL